MNQIVHGKTFTLNMETFQFFKWSAQNLGLRNENFDS